MYRVSDNPWFLSSRVRRNSMSMVKGNLKQYEKPVLVKHKNLKQLTFECVDWQCSVVVPPAP